MPQSNDPVRVRPADESEVFRRWMDEFFGFSRPVARQGGEAWVPPTDIYETEQDVVIKMSVPGIKTQNVRVLFDGDVVTISGYRESPPEAGLVAYHRMEIRNGYFERRVVIHRPINPEAATAQYRDGFLWIQIPKVGVRVHRVYALRLRL